MYTLEKEMNSLVNAHAKERAHWEQEIRMLLNENERLRTELGRLIDGISVRCGVDGPAVGADARAGL